jgi:hypothetical protein
VNFNSLAYICIYIYLFIFSQLTSPTYRSQRRNVNRMNIYKRLVWYDIFIQLCIEHQKRRCTRTVYNAVAVNVRGNYLNRRVKLTKEKIQTFSMQKLWYNIIYIYRSHEWQKSKDGYEWIPSWINPTRFYWWIQHYNIVHN